MSRTQSILPAGFKYDERGYIVFDPTPRGWRYLNGLIEPINYMGHLDPLPALPANIIYNNNLVLELIPQARYEPPAPEPQPPAPEPRIPGIRCELNKSLFSTPNSTLTPTDGPQLFTINTSTPLRTTWKQIAYGSCPMGCGYNVLAWLNIISRQDAENGVKRICNNHNSNIRDDGLVVAGMIEKINSAIGNQLQLERSFIPWTQISQEQIFYWIFDQLRKSCEYYGMSYSYTIVKIQIGDPTNSSLGHSVICSYNNSTGKCDVIDAQKNRTTEVSDYIKYLKSAERSYKYGLNFISHSVSRGGTKTKRTKKMSYQLNDSEFRHLTIEEEAILRKVLDNEDMYFNGLEEKKHKKSKM